MFNLFKEIAGLLKAPKRYNPKYPVDIHISPNGKLRVNPDTFLDHPEVKRQIELSLKLQEKLKGKKNGNVG